MASPSKPSQSNDQQLKKSLWINIGLVFAVALFSVLTTTYLLYQAALKETGNKLEVAASSQAKFLSLVLNNDLGEVLSKQQFQSLKSYEGFGETGEFVIANRIGGELHFVSDFRHASTEQSRIISMESSLAAPMRLAFERGSGIIKGGADYRDASVLAAYYRVPGHDTAVVAKIDLNEVRFPYIRSALIAALFSMFSATLAGYVIYRMNRHQLAQLEKSGDELQVLNNRLREIQVKRDQLFGMVAHELRTPVAAISMMCKEHEAGQWELDRKQLESITDDLLNTIEDMRLTINPDLERPIRLEIFSVGALNAAVAANVASIVAATGVRFHQSNELPLSLRDKQFRADTYRIRIALTNLIKNACLHSGGDDVGMLSGLTTHAGKDYIEWRVSDNGGGIPPEQWKRLFAAGERGDTQAEGTGLGLYITKTWIEEIDGAVEYHCKESGGSEFAIRIPLIQVSDEEIIDVLDPAPNSDRLNLVMGRLNVLMIEDEPMLRMLGHKLISRLTQSAQTAENGREGLEYFDPDFHNLVITDYFMPEMSGTELIRCLRERGYTGVILGLTAATIGQQREEMVASGADWVMAKPLDSLTFKKVLVELIEKGRFDELFQTETP